MKDLAREAGVSVMTVSRALRNDPSISPATAERIRKLAEERGYVPNPLVSALMAGVSRKRIKHETTLGFLTLEELMEPGAPLHEFGSAAMARANELGFRTEMFSLNKPGLSGKRLSEILAYREIRGLLIFPLLKAHSHLSLEWSRFVSATIGYSLRQPIHRACQHHYNNALIALRQLRRLRYKRIGLAISARTDVRFNYSYTGAYHTYMASHPSLQGAPVYVLPIRDKDFQGWLKKHRIEVVLTALLHGESIHDWLKGRGYRVPEDIGLCELEVEGGDRTLSGIDQNKPQVASAAIDLIAAHLHRNELGLPAFPKFVLIEGVWRLGTTLRQQ